MQKVSNIADYIHLFSDYTHNIPVIYSSLEGQYNGELYVDSETKPQVAVLFTPFAFHFVAGNAEIADADKVLEEIIFKQYILNTGQKEAIVFSPNEYWDSVLDKVFARYNGIKDKRKIFCLNKDKFIDIQNKENDLQGVELRIMYEQEGGAQKQYPVCRIFKGSECISFCSAFMLGKGHAEIDVATEELHRGKGYAKEASIALIKELIKNRIEPDWCTWPYRIESQKLAYSLGFELTNEIWAHIWVEEECGKIHQI